MIAKSQVFKAFLAVLVLSIFLSMSCGSVAHASSGFSNSSISGTYLAIGEDSGKIMQISADGNITLIFSDQFLGKGSSGESYSSGLGTWKRIGVRKIVAQVVDISYYGDSATYEGVAAYKATIIFSRGLRTAHLTCEGGLYDPGVDPFASDAVPTDTFDCGNIEYHRIRP